MTLTPERHMPKIADIVKMPVKAARKHGCSWTIVQADGSRWSEARINAVVAALNRYDEMIENLAALVPLAEWALLEQSPVGHDQHLVDAAKRTLLKAQGDSAL